MNFQLDIHTILALSRLYNQMYVCMYVWIYLYFAEEWPVVDVVDVVVVRYSIVWGFVICDLISLSLGPRLLYFSLCFCCSPALTSLLRK